MNTPNQYVHKPIPVEAWQVDLENLKSVAKWCGGKVRGECVVFMKPHNIKDTRADSRYHYAGVGSYVVKTNRGYTRMADTEFKKLYWRKPSGLPI